MDGSGGLPRAVIGRPDFIEQIGLKTAERDEAAAAAQRLIEDGQIASVRVGFVDTHGLPRVRAIEARHFLQTVRNGMPFTTALLAMDSSNSICMPVFSEDGGFGEKAMGGAGDMLAVPDLATFRVLPWAPRTAWILSDLYMRDGQRCPFDSRFQMQKACATLADQGLGYLGGIEVECHVLRVDDANTDLADCGQPPTPPKVSALRHGYQYMSEALVDELDPITQPIREALLAIGLPLRTVETEWGPGQLEITLDPLSGVAAADAMIMLRSAVKQVCRRRGLMATFMTKPALPNAFTSGWHLHQSLIGPDGANSFVSTDALVSPTGLGFIGGLLKHMRAGTAFSNPTINGYKRLNTSPLAPKRAGWSHENKGAMCRLIGGTGISSTHIENRSGEPCANPYLYMASQIYAGLDGIASKADPGPPLDDPHGQMQMEAMPTSLMEAVEALDKSALFRASFGDAYMNYFIGMKRFEIFRFLSAVTDWEHREYFEAY
jgi:glutamine synthetase